MRFAIRLCVLGLCVLAALVSVGNLASAQPGRGQGFRGGRLEPGAGEQERSDRGPGRHGPGRLGMGRPGQGGQGQRRHGSGRGGPGHDERHAADREVFQFLLGLHDAITRSVKELPNGVETLTESDDPEVAAKIKEHVEWMAHRIENRRPIRMRDPLFAELFRFAHKIDLQHEDTEKGVRVVETSKDPYVAKLIQQHARVVSGFVDRGFAEAMKVHPVGRDASGEAVSSEPKIAEPAEPKASEPKIKEFGHVVQLPQAVQQPRSGAKFLVDLTSGGQSDKMNEAIEKVARFVNIYHAAGSEPATAQIAVVLHGDATLTCLNDDAYANQFDTDGNPNLDCLHRLHEAGVDIYVCGQSLLAKKQRPEDVVVFVDVAVSALTSLVNLQAEGYAYVPLD